MSTKKTPKKKAAMQAKKEKQLKKNYLCCRHQFQCCQIC